MEYIKLVIGFIWGVFWGTIGFTALFIFCICAAFAECRISAFNEYMEKVI